MCLPYLEISDPLPEPHLFFYLALSCCFLQMTQEISIHKEVSFRHIVKFHCFFEDSDFVFILLELCRRRVGDFVFILQILHFHCEPLNETLHLRSWTNRIKPHPHTPHLSGLTSSLSNNVACLLTFVWGWTCIAMTLSAEIWCLSYSKPYVMSDLIQNIWKTSQVRWKLILDW